MIYKILETKRIYFWNEIRMCSNILSVILVIDFIDFEVLGSLYLITYQ